MSSLLKRGVFAVLGVAVMLGWWSLRGSKDNTQQASTIPAKVYDGGAGTMTVEVESSCPATMSIGFEERKDNGRHLQANEKIAAGSRSWTIDIPPGFGGYIELEANAPKVGDKLSMRVKLNGTVVFEDQDELKEELKSGYAFFVQGHFDDYSKMERAQE